MNHLRREYERAQALLAGRPGQVHLMGAGGVGMAGLARLLAGRRWHVDGCDAAPNRLAEWLIRSGIPVARNHDPRHLRPGLAWLVHTAAIPPAHPEIAEADRQGIAVTCRGIALAALTSLHPTLAVAGTHGKTTTSTMLAQVALRARAEAGYAIGGEFLDREGCAQPPAEGAPLVVEADESDGTLAFYTPEIAVVTNVDFDHMEHFADERAFHDTFRSFIAHARRAVVVCADDGPACTLAASCRSLLRCGLAPDSEVRGSELEPMADGTVFNVYYRGQRLGRVRVMVPGIHNVRNALCAIGATLAMGWPFDLAQDALETFRLPRRRLELVWNRSEIRVYSDYAHHPTEIRALLDTVKMFGARRILAIFQPHRYTRTRALGPQFANAFEGVERLWLLPVYAASEPPLDGGRSEDLLGWFQRAGRMVPTLLATLEEAWTTLRSAMRPGDIILIIGAGDIEKLADRFRADVERL